MMKETSNLVLLGASGIYFFAFYSLYHQLPGLYSDRGILPVNGLLAEKDLNQPLNSFLSTPNILYFTKALNLTTYDGLELVALCGTVLSLLMTLFARWRNVASFAALYLLYMACYSVGQTFLHFQWDIMLLEFGVVCIVLCVGEAQGLFLLRWLLLRLLLHSGYKKLESGCPTWWGLTALDWHFESQCIPTPLAYYAHHAPKIALKFGVAVTYLTQLGVSILAVSPNRRLRIFGAWCHILHQLGILATGNYNFFNLLTIICCVGCFDDEHLSVRKKKSKETNLIMQYGTVCLEMVQLGALIYVAYLAFDFNMNEMELALNETAEDMSKLKLFIKTIVKPVIVMGALSLLVAIWRDVCRSPMKVIASVLSVTIFCASLVPFCDVDRETLHSLPRQVHQLKAQTDAFELVHSYGLFRRMTGVGGRPEVVLEMATADGTWHEVEFRYKPTNLARSCPWCFPHQPRVDWQMWFAALGTYQHNPWLLQMAYRLLQSEETVLNLIEREKFESDFGGRKVKYIRMWHYTYHYTDMTSTTTWVRDKKREYLPTLSLDHDGLKRFAKENRLDAPAAQSKSEIYQKLRPYLSSIRLYLDKLSAEATIWTIVLSISVIKLI